MNPWRSMCYGGSWSGPRDGPIEARDPTERVGPRPGEPGVGIHGPAVDRPQPPLRRARAATGADRRGPVRRGMLRVDGGPEWVAGRPPAGARLGHGRGP